MRESFVALKYQKVFRSKGKTLLTVVILTNKCFVEHLFVFDVDILFVGIWLNAFWTLNLPSLLRMLSHEWEEWNFTFLLSQHLGCYSCHLAIHNKLDSLRNMKSILHLRRPSEAVFFIRLGMSFFITKHEVFWKPSV